MAQNSDNTYSPSSLQPERLRGLPKYLHPLAEQAVTEILAQQAIYRDIEETALAGKTVRGRDFIDSEAIYNQHMEHIRQQAREAIVMHIAALPQPAPDHCGAVPSFADRVEQQYRDFKYAVILQQGEDHIWGEKKISIGAHSKADIEALDRAFQKHYVDGAPVENKTLDAAVVTQRGLLTALLQQNRGIALGDFHTQEEPVKLLTDNMALLKKLGVDTIYTEYSDSFNQINAMSIADLKELAERHEKNGVRIPTAEEQATYYKVDHSGDSAKIFIEMLIAAKEQGILVVNIDRQGKAREDEGLTTPYSYRVAQTNFIWTDNILADRENIQKTTGAEGKFVVFGGFNHFADSATGKGMVDEALGIPFLANSQGGKSQPAEFMTGPVGWGAPDFYLRPPQTPLSKKNETDKSK
jgi:hypothetical protein